MNKLINADSRITDRFIYNEAVSIKNVLLKQEEDKQRLYNTIGIFKTLNKVELVESNTIEACGIKSDCCILRTKYSLPKMVETVGGPLIRQVSSLDGSTNTNFITDLSFARKLAINDKDGNKEPLAFFKGDENKIYFANVSWPYAIVQAVFEDPDEIDNLNSCDDDKITCTAAFDRVFAIPNYLEKSLKDLLNNSLLNYYHRLVDDNEINKKPG